MALYAIGDFHLALGMDKPMDVFGEKWANHDQKLKPRSPSFVTMM